jgi:hypothetical protein
VDRIKIGKYEAEPLTAKVATSAGLILLTQVLPGRWSVQRPGRPDEDHTPTWDGGAFIKLRGRVPSFEKKHLEAEIDAALSYLAAGAADAVSTTN